MDNDKDNKSKPLSEENQALWDHMMRDVKPLRKGRGSLDEPEAARKKPQLKAAPYASTPPSIPADTVKSAPRPPHKKTAAPQIDRRTDERLRKGQMPIEARLDMHGMTRDQAQDALVSFIGAAYARGNRCVLVITGKGLKDRDPLGREEGVLKNSLPGWLKDAPLKDIVLKAYPAKPKDGGSGAAYLLIRRKRD